MATETQKARIKELVNNLNLGAQKEDLGSIFVEMLDKIEDLEARVLELEGA